MRLYYLQKSLFVHIKYMKYVYSKEQGNAFKLTTNAEFWCKNVIEVSSFKLDISEDDNHK